MDFAENKPVTGWIAGVEFPVLLFWQVCKSKDGSTGILYLVSSDLGCDAESLKTIYKRRWKVEVFYKTLKSNAAMAKSPAHTVRTQSNHVFLSIYSVFRLETLSLKLNMNHFQLRVKIYLSAQSASFNRATNVYSCVALAILAGINIYSLR
ncbi:hypothetical protein M3P05_15325 [Sansalvadorimonas sp. 2012CJ34-2]|uniref:Transposase IS4-like domain-containing protein n=1 Tax=Parendozoicomonas callyspongiae TaxID=2942213 RepID=A0ABT0PJ56_9GAMM|nr:hypothetical protein [Sansalvadorimonas sp. 2012CJ34-2]MCL6271296.1 hypothetical protein [Sansalvadorimonas sp. 2012CJ34-2]